MAINFPDSPSNGDTVTVGDKTWTWNGSTWDVVVSTPISNQIIDADGDTRVHVEESPDEDYLRFDTAGTERMTINPSGNVAMTGDLTVTGTIAGGSTTFPTTLDSGTMPAIEALQAKVGVNSSAVATSHDYILNQPTAFTLKAPLELWTISATAATGTVNVDLKSSGAHYFTADATANWTYNFRGDASTSLDSVLAVGESVTAVHAVTNGATAYYPTAFQVDGSAVTPKWSGGSAPTSGNASSVDAYLFTVVKTASATFTVLAQQVQFA